MPKNRNLNSIFIGMERKKITVSKELRQELKKDFNLSDAVLCNYLYFRRFLDEAKMIREVALQRGGKLVIVKEEEMNIPKRTIKILDNKGNVKAIKPYRP